MIFGTKLINNDGSLTSEGRIGLVLFICFLFVSIILGLEWKTVAENQAAVQADPTIGFLYQDNPVAAITLGCATRHDQTKDRLTIKNGKYFDTLYSAGITYYFYSPDTIFDDMQSCMSKAGIVFRYTTNKAIPDVEVIHAIFRRCTDSKISSGWYNNLPYIRNSLACMIKNGLTLGV